MRGSAIVEVVEPRVFLWVERWCASLRCSQRWRVSLVAGIGFSRLAGLLQHAVGGVGAMLHAEEHIVGNELAFFVAFAVDMRFFHAADDK